MRVLAAKVRLLAAPPSARRKAATSFEAAACAEAQRALAEFPSADAPSMMRFIAAHRCEPVQLLEIPRKPGAPSAFWAVELSRSRRVVRNWIIADAGMDNLAFDHAVRHEVGHMWWNDRPLAGAVTAATERVVVGGRVLHVVARRACQGDSYRELRAELFAVIGTRADEANPSLRGLLRSLSMGRR